MFPKLLLMCQFIKYKLKQTFTYKLIHLLVYILPVEASQTLIEVSRDPLTMYLPSNCRYK